MGAWVHEWRAIIGRGSVEAEGAPLFAACVYVRASSCCQNNVFPSVATIGKANLLRRLSWPTTGVHAKPNAVPVLFSTSRSLPSAPLCRHLFCASAQPAALAHPSSRDARSATTGAEEKGAECSARLAWNLLEGCPLQRLRHKIPPPCATPTSTPTDASRTT